ncbi:MAG: NYN domain-containing protein [Planctomycetales bacterium]
MMSSFSIIIDGYNLLHAAGFAKRRYGPGGLHKSRQQLLRFLLRSLSPAERDQTIVVFDARDRPLEASDHAGCSKGYGSCSPRRMETRT